MLTSVILMLVLMGSFLSVNLTTGNTTKPVICILGGTPSTKAITDFLPDSLKEKYHFISFNRPGFGGTENGELTKEKLYELAREAGLRKGDFGVIGISGGAPMAILLASEFKLAHCGIIGGMVPREPYFKNADNAITKDIFSMALQDYDKFKEAVSRFPNVDMIIEMAGASTAEIAIRACYDEFEFILSEDLFSKGEDLSVKMEWYHGRDDLNVPIAAVKAFIGNNPNAKLNIIENADHTIHSNVYVAQFVNNWK